MNHTKLIGIKFIATFILLFLVLGIGFTISIADIVLINMVSILAYFVGDLLILSRTNNTIATLADISIAFVVIFLMTDALLASTEAFIAALLSAVLIGLYEWFFHPFVIRGLSYSQNKQAALLRANYLMESSDELGVFFQPEDQD